MKDSVGAENADPTKTAACSSRPSPALMTKRSASWVPCSKAWSSGTKHAAGRLSQTAAKGSNSHGDCPADHYKASTRPYPERLLELEYPAGFELRKADEGGKIRWKQARCRLGDALAHEVIGIEAVDDGMQRIWFGPVLLGLLDERKGYKQAATKETSSWPPLRSPYGLPTRRPTAKKEEEDKSTNV